MKTLVGSVGAFSNARGLTARAFQFSFQRDSQPTSVNWKLCVNVAGCPFLRGCPDSYGSGTTDWRHSTP